MSGGSRRDSSEKSRANGWDDIRGVGEVSGTVVERLW